MTTQLDLLALLYAGIVGGFAVGLLMVGRRRRDRTTR
jgi:hypothetical protein